MNNGRKLGRFIKIISTAYDATKNTMLERYDLTSRQIDLLVFLMEHEQREASQKEITEYLHASYATTSGIISRLTEKGFVERLPCEDDKRSNVIRLTDGAVSVVKECAQEFRAIDGLVMAGFTDEDKELLMNYLERLLVNAESIRHAR